MKTKTNVRAGGPLDQLLDTLDDLESDILTEQVAHDTLY